MSQQEYEPFSRWWDILARRLGLSSEGGGPGDVVRPLKSGKKRRRTRFFLVAAVIVLLMFLGRGVHLYTEWLWFGEVGYKAVFIRMLTTKIWLGLAAGVVFFGVIYGNILLARRMAPQYRITPDGEIVERSPAADRLLAWLIPVALVIPVLIVAGVGSSAWDELLKLTNRSSFGTAEPIFGYDIGFYVFVLPFLQMLQSFAWWTLVFALIAVTATHFFDYAISWSENRLNFAPHVKAHLSVVLGLIMIVLAAGYLLKGYALLFSQRGVVFGATYTDVHAQLPVYRFLAATAVVAGILFLVNIYFKGWKLPLAALGIIIITAIFAGRVYPFLVQQYQVSPNEIVKEEPYIKHNIDFTRQAFDLDAIEEKPFAAAESLTRDDIQANSNTINNIRLWDPKTLAQTYSQIQVIRLYYNFKDVDVDRYEIDGRLQQVMLSPREMAVEQLPDRARTWQNEHLVYTHGYGAVVSQVAQVSGEGLPLMLVKDIPPQSSVPELEIKQPAIYYGEQSGNYVVVRTDTKEFDYPLGDDNVYTTYEGGGGVSISGALPRLAFSWRYGSLKLMVSDSITADSRIMIHREINDRISNIAPFLSYDHDPYCVIADGRIFWIQDAYTTTGNYPYSQPATDGYNYIRNPVKVVVDAYNGDVTFYVVDETDPIINTYRQIFPDLFTPADRMPEGLRRHLRYPQDLFLAQAQMYTTYHMTDSQVFYNKEDQWSIPRLQSGDRAVNMDPYYVIMSLPGGEQEEFMMMLPFSPSTKDNMISWMAAKSDPESYGQRLVYKFPKDKLVFGPAQIQARINQDPEISRQLSLWAQKGSQVIHGNMLVIPVNESILYVEPLYLRAEKGQIPELKRVTVAYGSRIAMEENLSLALQKIFTAPVSAPSPAPPEAGAPAPGPQPVESIKDLAARAQDHYNRAVEAQKQGNWATYGSELKQLEEVLKQMQAAGG